MNKDEEYRSKYLDDIIEDIIINHDPKSINMEVTEINGLYGNPDRDRFHIKNIEAYCIRMGYREFRKKLCKRVIHSNILLCIPEYTNQFWRKCCICKNSLSDVKSYVWCTKCHKSIEFEENAAIYLARMDPLEYIYI